MYALRMLTVRKSRKCHLRAYQVATLALALAPLMIYYSTAVSEQKVPIHNTDYAMTDAHRIAAWYDQNAALEHDRLTTCRREFSISWKLSLSAWIDWVGIEH